MEKDSAIGKSPAFEMKGGRLRVILEDEMPSVSVRGETYFVSEAPSVTIGKKKYFVEDIA